MKNPIHNFHIPVMGLAYTVDSPIKVAHYGISSVISIIQDSLVEKMRQYYHGANYEPITQKEDDYRAKRITDYLNLVNKIVHAQFDKLRSSAFEAGSNLVLYFEMLPNDSSIKQLYNKMLNTDDGHLKETLQNTLRSVIRPGSIDVNIMSKLDKNTYDSEGNILEDNSDAVSVLRGYVNSDLKDSSIVFSAGMNPRLYNYIEKCLDRLHSDKGLFEKKIVIKVSDYRSAVIQGKYLAKKGIWVSEFRVESGLNCGGHAFATEGYLLGSIMEEFRIHRETLKAELYDVYSKGLIAKGLVVPQEVPEMLITVQGGLGTHDEHEFLLDYCKVDSVGWGSPFLLVEEATTVDEETIDKLCQSKESDIVLSKHSPLGVRLNYLTGLSGEKERLDRVASGKPGSPCTEGFLALTPDETNGRTICTASITYLRRKLAELKTQNLSSEDYEKQAQKLYNPECLCVGLSNSAFIKNNLGPIKGNTMGVTMCAGPSIAYFNKRASLKEMVDHIYGRTNLLDKSQERPHFFVKELSLYIDYLKEELSDLTTELDVKAKKYYTNFCNNLLSGIDYYKNLISTVLNAPESMKEKMKSELLLAETQVKEIAVSF